MTALSTDKVNEFYDIRDVGKRAIRAVIYFFLFILFAIIFTRITPYYMNISKELNGPIDTRARNCKCIDQEYVKDVKEKKAYKFPEYLKSFALMDLVFPLLYTAMFLTLIKVRKNEKLYKGGFKKFYNVFFCFIYPGMIFDYLENISFFLYLTTELELSLFVAIMTSIKTLLFSLNLLGFLIALIRTSVIFFKNRKLYRLSSLSFGKSKV